MVLAAIEVDLVALVDRVLGTGAQARVAARAKVEVDRIFLRPGDLECAEPSLERRDLAGVDRIRALGRQRGAARAPRRKDGHGHALVQRLGPMQRCGRAGR
jgi:hypothetical protein